MTMLAYAFKKAVFGGFIYYSHWPVPGDLLINMSSFHQGIRALKSTPGLALFQQFLEYQCIFFQLHYCYSSSPELCQIFSQALKAGSAFLVLL